MKNPRKFRIKISSLNEKGYGVGKIIEEVWDDRGVILGRKEPLEIYALGALVGEEVVVECFKSKRGVYYSNTIEVVKPASFRVLERDHLSYLSSSPWQIMSFQKEMEVKKELLKNLYPNYIPDCVLDCDPCFKDIEIVTDGVEWGYRNKVEFSFYETYGSIDDYSLKLAFFKREGNGGKYSMEHGCSLMSEKMNRRGLEVVHFLESKRVLGKDIKTVVIRETSLGSITYLYVTKEDFFTIYPGIEEQLKFMSVGVIYSDHRCPASRNDGYLLELESTSKEIIEVLGKSFSFEFAYDGFFQVNLPVFKKVIERVDTYIKNLEKSGELEGTLLDLYSGVGVIGMLLSRHFSRVVGVDCSLESQRYSLINAKENGLRDSLEGTDYEFLHSEAEKVVDQITGKELVFLDPPRSGLHQDVISKIREVKPKNIIYLSCNPYTQVKNIAELEDLYNIELVEGYNFYPKTPHLECLVILKLSSKISN